MSHRRWRKVLQGLPLQVMVLLMLCGLLGACGKKGPVRPLLEDRPSAPDSLAGRQQGMQLLISWTAPRTNQNGEPLTDLLGFRIYRMRYDLAADCPECRDTSVLVQEVDLDYLREVRQYEGRYYFWDDRLEAGYGYQYRVVAFDRKGHNGAPAQIREPFTLPPPPPENLQATGHDRLVRLSWDAAQEPRQGIAVTGYNIYRRRLGEPFPPLPLNAAPLSDTFFEDFGLENEVPYTYGVRTVIRLLESNVESELSATETVKPQPGR